MKNKFLSVAASTAIVASALVFTGCGDSDSSSSTSSSSTTSSGGTSSAIFFKGPWGGISYTGTTSGTGTTNNTGHFSYSANENVTFNLGLMNLKIVNTTASVSNGVTYATQAINTDTGVAPTATEIGNLLGVLSAFGINETQTNSTNMAKLPTLLSSLASLKSTYNVSSATFDENVVTAALAAKAGIANVSTPLSDTDAYSAFNTAMTAQMVTAGASAASLNSTFMSSKAIFFTDGTNITMNGSVLQNGTALSPTTSLDITGAGGNLSTNKTVCNLATGWTASGATINSSNGAAVMLQGPLAAGTKATLKNSTGAMTTLTIAGVGYNLATVTGGVANASIAGTYKIDGKNYIFTPAGNTSTFTVDGLTVGSSGATIIGLGYALNMTNASANASTINQTIMVDDAATATTGVVSQIFNAIASFWTSLVKSVSGTLKLA